MQQSDGIRDQTMAGSMALTLLVCQLLTSRYSDAALMTRPHNTSALLGTSATLQCSTNMSTPVNWYCSGTCSANTTTRVVYLLMADVLTESFAHRVSIIRSNFQTDGAKTAQYDIHINPVTPQDAGVYTCVDEAGLGAKASATLSVVPPSTSQPSSTTRVSSTTRYTTRLSLSSTHDEDILSSSMSTSQTFVAVILVLIALIIITVIIIITIFISRQPFARRSHGRCPMSHRRRPSKEENDYNQLNLLRVSTSSSPTTP